jgi:hypothetical protein
MERSLIILGIGIAIGYFAFRSKLGSGVIEVIKPGDKGKDIEGMQRLFERVAKLQFNEYGVYDQETVASVNYLLKNTNALKSNTGAIDKKFCNDLSQIYFNSLTV